ncbi:MAG: hypothetical protein GQ539_13245, partial [Sulfitobacter sp.]|nr:hypothetical protein [Sulfitobacter sp.]
MRVNTETTREIKGAKHRALIALLATAPMGRRTRNYLQTTLWGYAGYDSGHQNLRRALSDLRKILGADFDALFHTTNSDIELDLENVCFAGDPNAGPFLDDLNVQEAAFLSWVSGIRKAPDQVLALFRMTPRTCHSRSRPSVTTLPLAVLDGDPNLRILADWVAEETCRSLSRSNLLTVISHLSSRAMAHKMIDIADIRDTLDVDYIVTGTLYKQGSDLIVNFDFVDARNGNILWNRHFGCPADHFTEQMHER